MLRASGIVFASWVSVLAAAAFPAHVQAQEPPPGYPARPIRIITSSVPGGGLDLLTRAVAQALSDRFGQSAIVDNRPGGGTVVATELAARSQPDGYTFFTGTDTLRVVSITKRVRFDVRKAFDPVAAMSSQPYILIVNPTLPVKNVKELAAYSLTHQVSYGSSGIGTVAHLGLETLNAISGARFVHVPYKGGAQSLLALLSGEVQMYPGLLLSANAAVKAGKARMLAALSLQRIAALPDLPTVAEQGFPGFKITNSYSLYAPAGVPRPILLALNRIVSDFMNSPQMSQKLTAEGSASGERMTLEQLKAAFASDYEDVERQIGQLKIKLF
jgi:tripartite-type tricarboxylate transporter receptor subunit TctC